METTTIIEKIKKLLALANSSNEHEAALAASHVQRLLSEYNLELADIETSIKPDKAESVETTAAKNPPKWLRHLSAGVSNAFDCQAVHHPASGRMTFIGVGADVHIAVYTFTYLERTVRKLCTAYAKKYASDVIKRQQVLLRQSYCLGAVSTILSRLEAQKIATPVTTGALVPVKDMLIKQAMHEIGNIRTRHSRRSFIDSGAYISGKADGRTIKMHDGIESTAPSSHIGRFLNPRTTMA